MEGEGQDCSIALTGEQEGTCMHPWASVFKPFNRPLPNIDIMAHHCTASHRYFGHCRNFVAELVRLSLNLKTIPEMRRLTELHQGLDKVSHQPSSTTSYASQPDSQIAN